MSKDDQGFKKPGKTYWLINGILLAIFTVIFLIDIVYWQRFSGSLVFLLITGGMSVFCYVQYKSLGEKENK